MPRRSSKTFEISIPAYTSSCERRQLSKEMTPCPDLLRIEWA